MEDKIVQETSRFTLTLSPLHGILPEQVNVESASAVLFYSVNSGLAMFSPIKALRWLSGCQHSGYQNIGTISAL
jgi:hypothetical protein